MAQSSLSPRSSQDAQLPSELLTLLKVVLALVPSEVTIVMQATRAVSFRSRNRASHASPTANSITVQFCGDGC